jgi:hypothetical protein
MTMLGFLSSEALADLFMNVLKVVGGFLVGYLAGWLSVILFRRWVLGRPTLPQGFYDAGQYLGGAVGAILVALYVFSGKGPGSGGAGQGEGTLPTLSTGSSTGGAVSTVPVLPDPPKPTPLPPSLLVVTLLGGEDVVEEKFYQIGPETKAYNFQELKAELIKRKEQNKEKLGLEIRFHARNMLSRDHIAVRRLEAWAQNDGGLAVTFPSMP